MYESARTLSTTQSQLQVAPSQRFERLRHADTEVRQMRKLATDSSHARSRCLCASRSTTIAAVIARLVWATMPR